MTCEEFQRECLERLDGPDRPLSPEMRDHLSRCRECGGFLRVLDVLAAPSPELDRRVLRDYRARNARRRRAARLLLPLAAAAAVLLLLVLPGRRPLRPAPPGTATAPEVSPDWETQLLAADDELADLELEMYLLLGSL